MIMSKSPPTGLFSRSTKILAAASRIAAKELKAKALSKVSQFDQLNTKIEQSKELVKVLGELKGGAMKFGQMLSVDADDWLPKEAVQILSKLQKEAPKVDSEIMIQAFHASIPKIYSKKVVIDKDPIAQASIGQVYKAKYNEQDIVIKIQYPQIATTIESDLKLLKPIISSFSKVMGKKINYDQSFEEIKKILILESDYKNEAEQIKKYSILFKNSNYLVPTVIDELSSDTVLAMSYIKGITLGEWIETNPSIEKKEKVAIKLLNLFKVEFFQNGMVQTDPNPANFLIQDEDLRIGLLDLGATIHYDKEFIEDYRLMISHVINQDTEKMVECFTKSNLLDSRESKECIDIFIDMQYYASRPFIKEFQPFDYSSVEFNSNLKKNAFKFVKSLRYSSPPKDFIFLHRKLGGIFLILKKLGVKIDTSTYFDDIL